MATVEHLYKAFGVLADAKEKAGEHEAEYRLFMEAVKGSQGEKRLASQFLTRFFKHFPGLARDAINAMFDLCEDNDINIRKQAIKDLPSLCRVSPEHTVQIAEALTQLLTCEDATELGIVQSALVTLFSISARGVLEGIFQQILAEHEEEDPVREKALKFLVQKLKTLPDDALDKDCDDFVIADCKKVLEDVTKDEFMAVMDILRSLKSMSTVQGRQQLVEIVTEQAELDQPLQVSDADCVDRLLQCIKTAAPLFSKNVHSKAFVGYLCDYVLPELPHLASPDDEVNIQLEMLKLFAEISEHAGDLENVQSRVEKVFDRLLAYMPLPPSDEEEDMSATEEPKLQFSYVECLMYAFHQLARRCPLFLADEANSERLKDFKIRLQYFARGVQVYIKQLRAALQGKAGDELRTNENKIKVVALKITSNINALIKDLFHSPPAYKAAITLSWKPVVSKTTNTSRDTPPTPGQKRITPITYSSNGTAPKKTNKEDRALYSPPSGKFSQKAGNFYRGGQGGNQGGRGGFRGRRGQNFQRY
ncbi:hypothetical protein C0Q70_05319 [Pomacea canaliculata]|uniref:Apoptosis inhibitor 5 n=1 Tax=Pomacea canaliculata TaxID=400727 RepID=A0A2T7PKZ2_POMCA|nr:apoptosis inhibitor 5-like [Pomacea canaliculata]PVD34057.1 hypothetical protein C0Q70_05319 [Pomacea canaliculata]